MAGGLNEVGVRSEAIEATEVIITDDDYGQAEPLMEQVRERATARLGPLFGEGITPVVTGFIGATAEGALTTLGRGGSDYSATVIGAALDADEIILWSCWTGGLSTSPRL